MSIYEAKMKRIFVGRRTKAQKLEVAKQVETFKKIDNMINRGEISIKLKKRPFMKRLIIFPSIIKKHYKILRITNNRYDSFRAALKLGWLILKS